MSRTVHLDEIPYCPDSCQLFERIRLLPGAALLDSSHPHSRSGRFDILTACPAPDGPPGLAPDPDERQCREYFRRLRDYTLERYAGIQPVSPDLPFCGGLLGYLGYDCGNALHGVARTRVARIRTAPTTGTDMPPALLRAYDWCVVQDHLLRRSVLVAQPAVKPGERRELLARLRTRAPARTTGFSLRAPFVSNLTPQQYRSAFEEVQAYIHAGDCYQVNLAQRFSAPCRGDPWHAYRNLRRVAAAPFSAYLALEGNAALMSLSPERFLSLHGHHVETSPVKGTRPRHVDPEADRFAAAELCSSGKDRAENLMIVDLLRNDLGRSCVAGSVHVDRLFELQSFATVHHLVSTISGELRADCHVTDLLRDSFPGGSITGAPKRRAMEIIAELEPDPREVYCGSLLYISADGRMDSNIAIRTLLCDGEAIRCWGGGGIVADSRWQQEYQESWDKIGGLLSALETEGE